MTDYYTCRDCHGYIFTCGCRERKEPVIAVMQSERREPDANENPYSRARLNSENTKLRAEITRLTEALRAAEEREKGLQEDVKRFEIEEVIAHCEGCSAPLLSNDDFVSDDDCVYGCWASMSDGPGMKDRPCYAYRVGKPDARAALKGPSHDA